MRNSPLKFFYQILAFVCRICPFCIYRRANPGTGFSRILTRVEINCPFCRAYDKLYPNEL